MTRSTDNQIFKSRKTIPASEVGVTLKVSDKALKEIDRQIEERIKAMREMPNIVWR